MKTIFISGSRAIDSLTNEIKENLDIYIQNNYKFLVGDAEGVDDLIQEYLAKNGDEEAVSVYFVGDDPRFCSSLKFVKKQILSIEKDPRKKQASKDVAMTQDSDISFVIRDGESRGSYANILRAIENGKDVICFYKDVQYKSNNGLQEFKDKIQKIYRENVRLPLSEWEKELNITIKNSDKEKLKKLPQSKGVLVRSNAYGKDVRYYKKMALDFSLSASSTIQESPLFKSF